MKWPLWARACRALKEGDRVVINPRLSCQQCPMPASPAGMTSAPVPGSWAARWTAAMPSTSGFLRPTLTPSRKGVTYEQAAAIPTTYLPVWNMLVRRLQLKPWQTVSGAFGVGRSRYRGDTDGEGCYRRAGNRHHQYC